MKSSVLDHIKKVDVLKQDEIILRQLGELIKTGVLKPGDKLPPERVMAEQFSVGRGYVRLAIKRLEFYGVVKSLPQSGTVVSERGVTMLENIVGNIFEFEKPDGKALMESRMILEIETARLAATRVNEESFAKLKEAYNNHQKEVEKGNDAMDEDVLFHIRIAECADNIVLRSLIMIIAQDIVRQSREVNSCYGERKSIALKEHLEILKAIEQKNPGKAALAMKQHLSNTKIN